MYLRPWNMFWAFIRCVALRIIHVEGPNAHNEVFHHLAKILLNDSQCFVLIQILVPEDWIFTVNLPFFRPWTWIFCRNNFGFAQIFTLADLWIRSSGVPTGGRLHKGLYFNSLKRSNKSVDFWSIGCGLELIYWKQDGMKYSSRIKMQCVLK